LKEMFYVLLDQARGKLLKGVNYVKSFFCSYDTDEKVKRLQEAFLDAEKANGLYHEALLSGED